MFPLSLALTLLCAGAHVSALLTQNSEKVLIRRLSTHFDRFRRSTDCDLPPFLQFEFDVNGVHITLNLEKNERIKSNVPVFVPGENNGTAKEVLRDDEMFALYQDMSRGCAMLVSCDVDMTYRLQGSFHYEGIQYHMTPSNVPEAANDHTIEINHREKIDLRSDMRKLPRDKNNTENTPVNDSDRRKRAIPTGNVVEILFAVDSLTYQFHLNEQGTKDAAEEAIRRQVTMMANEIDVYYAGIVTIDPTVDIRIFVSGVFIDDNSGLSDWSSNSITTIGDKDYLDGTRILDEMETWLGAQTGLPAHDHLMGLSIGDVAIIQNGVLISDALSGVANYAEVCERPSKSLSFTQIEFHGRTAQTAAHELGHCLGALHDEDQNACLESDNNVMTPVFSVTTDSTYAQAQWTFSTCSVSQFKTHISGLTTNCMLVHSFDETAYNDMKNNGYPGEFYTIDQQCTWYQGYSSTGCSITDTVSESSCYAGFRCSDDTIGCGAGSYYPLYPMTGTKCGNSADDNICYKGQCVSRTVIITSTSTSTESSTSTSTTSTTTTSPTRTTSTTTTTPTRTTSTTTTSPTRTTSTTTTTPTRTTSTTTTSPTRTTSTTTTSPTRTTSTTTTSPTRTTSTTTKSPTTPSGCTDEECCVRVLIRGKWRKRCCTGENCCDASRPWAVDTECYKNCCPERTTLSSTSTSKPPTTTSVGCTDKKCCEMVEIDGELKKKCCVGEKCCSPSRPWAVVTECYKNCCDGQTTSSTTTKQTPVCIKSKKCCERVQVGDSTKKKCCKGKKCCKPKNSWAVNTSCYINCCT